MSRRDEVLEAAIALLDEVGLDGLTTRELAARLGVQAGALYRHYPSKQALLDAMTARIVDVASADTSKRPAVETDWRAQLRRAATQLREVMLSHRDGARLLSTFRVAGEAAVVAFRELVSVVEAAGASPAEAVIAVDTLVSFVNGFTLEEQARARPTQAASVRRSRAFDAGVELIVRGIEAALPARRRPKPRAAR